MQPFPEKPLTVSPQLAVALGLEEALLLQVLRETSLYQPDNQGFTLDREQLDQLTPFWCPRDIQRICNSLRDKGVLEIYSPPYTTCDSLRFSFHAMPDNRIAETQPLNRSAYTGRKGTNQIAPNWQPDTETLRQLAQYGIPQNFALEHTAEFVTYWHERGEPRHSWNAKFIKHTLRLWRHEQTAAAQRSQEIVIHQGWRPSQDALDILSNHAGINPNFIEDAIPEFILYWKERGITSSTWNSQFIQHVKRQWVKFTNAVEHESDPHLISPDWTPSEDLFEVLRLANISRQFAEQEIPPFVLFWRETGHAHNSWNTKFLQHVKRQWAYSQSPSAEINYGKQQTSDRSVSTRATSLVDDLTDRSWAS